jgi:hypothetical protein
MLLHLNYGLRGVYQNGPGLPYVQWNKGEMIDTMVENDCSFDDFELKMVDILELEKRFPILLDKNYEAIWFSLDQIAARWDRDESDVDDVLIQFGSEIVDPVGQPIDYMVLVHPSEGRVILPPSDFIYKKSDINRIETELELTPLRKTLASTLLPSDNITKPTQVTDDIHMIHFRKSGDFWLIGPDGMKFQPIKPMAGFFYIKILLENPHKEIDVLELSRLVSPTDPEPENRYGESAAIEKGFEFYQSQQEVTDNRSLVEVEEALEDLKARRKHSIDLEEKEGLEDHIDKLESYLRQAKLKGKARTFEKKEISKVRTNIQKRIKAALTHIHKQVPFLKAILNQESIRTGQKCSYLPNSEKNIEWVFE